VFWNSLYTSKFNFSTYDLHVYNQLIVVLSTNYPNGIVGIANLKNDLEQIKIAYTGNHEVILGTLNVGLSSAEFWSERSTTTYFGNDLEPVIDGFIVQADAGGYLVSWFDSWYIKETPNEKDRIRDGLSGAWQASMGALIGKWHK
jgi:hypothetical protein